MNISEKNALVVSKMEKKNEIIPLKTSYML